MKLAASTLVDTIAGIDLRKKCPAVEWCELSNTLRCRIRRNGSVLVQRSKVGRSSEPA